jgi:hypothetical protein
MNMPYLKLSLALVLLGIGGYFGWGMYSYYYSTSAPSIALKGLEADKGYADDIDLVVYLSDSYKIGKAIIKLDDKELIQKNFNKSSVSVPLKISAKELTQGKHMLDIEVENTALHKQTAHVSIPFYSDTLPLQASITKNEAEAKVFQGRTLHVVFQANKELKKAELKTLSNTYACFAQSPREHMYECFVPIETEEIPKEYMYTIAISDWAGHTMNLEGKFQVVAFPFKKQTVKIAPEKIKAENEAGIDEKKFEEEIEALTKKSPQQKLWHGTFITPIEIKEQGQITTEFGVIRATQERGLKQHKAVDVYTTPKSVVWATQDGIVVLKDRFVHSGNTVIIDHGFGILSLFFHLDTFAPIEVGDKIKKGNPVGTLGKTGYATGYHLHWEMRVNNVAVDPFEWTKPSF